MPRHPCLDVLTLLYVHACRAWLLVPNTIIHPAFGKLVFVAADLGVAVLLHRILQQRGVARPRCSLYSAAFVLNPLVINVSTRGNADALVCLLVVSVLHEALAHRWKTCAAMYVQVHVARLGAAIS